MSYIKKYGLYIAVATALCVCAVWLFFNLDFEREDGMSVTKIVLNERTRNEYLNEKKPEILSEYTEELKKLLGEEEFEYFYENGLFYNGSIVYCDCTEVEDMDCEILITIPVLIFSDKGNHLIFNNSDFLHKNEVYMTADDKQYDFIIGRYELKSEYYGYSENFALVRAGEERQLLTKFDASPVIDPGYKITYNKTTTFYA